MRPARTVQRFLLAALGVGLALLPWRVLSHPHSAVLHHVGTDPSKWWLEQRTFPLGTIPIDEYQQSLRKALADRANPDLSTSAGLLTWQFIGPDNIGGRITAMAVAPGGSPMYIGAANGGVFKSTDGGLSWGPIFDGYIAYSVGAVTIDPTNPNTVYVGTGESNPAIDTYDGNGIYSSTDAGLTWTHLGLENVKRIARIAVDPLNNQRILVAGGGSLFQDDTDGGIWRTTDGGVNWTHQLFVDNTTVGNDVIINPVHSDSVFCSMYDFGPSPETESAVWRSTDFGDTWTKLGPAQGLPSAPDTVDRIALAYAPSKRTTLYAQIIAGPGVGYTGLGMYRSTDAGATWTRRDIGTTFINGFGGFGWYFGTMAVDPVSADKVYALGVNFMRSLDGGVNWANLMSAPMHPDQHAIWINPSNTTRIRVGNDGGFFNTINGGTSWVKGLNLPISQFYAITVDPSNVLRPLGGTQDNNTLASGGTVSSWGAILGGDGFYCLVDPTNSNIVFAESQFMNGGLGPGRSTTGGSPFFAPTGISSSDRFNWDSPYCMDPQDHNVLLAGTQRVYKSTDNGVSYTAVSGDQAFNPSSTRPSGTISTVAISPVGPGYYYTGSTNGKVYRSTNSGASWQDITTGLPLRYITRVSPDPVDPLTVYVSLSAFNGSPENAHVYRSTDAGTNWTPIEGNLPNAPVNDIIVDPDNVNRIYVATDFGVYTTQNLGATWYPLGQGMPFQAVFDIYLHEASRKLFAGTHGRSMWQLDLTQIPLAVGGQPPAARIALSAPSPNPSHGNVAFTLALPTAGAARIAVYDTQGRLVRTLQDGGLTAGTHAFSWDGRDRTGHESAAGVYFLRANTSGASATRRIVRAG